MKPLPLQQNLKFGFPAVVVTFTLSYRSEWEINLDLGRHKDQGLPGSFRRTAQPNIGLPKTAQPDLGSL